MELKGTDVVLPDGTEYTYTGELIMPAVTVTVDGTVLTENQDYIVTYANNRNVGTATVTVTGTETTGYKGTVEIPFTIVEAPQEPTQPSEPTVPSEPSEPSEPTTPSEPSEPTVPSEPTTPSERFDRRLLSGRFPPRQGRTLPRRLRPYRRFGTPVSR